MIEKEMAKLGVGLADLRGRSRLVAVRSPEHESKDSTPDLAS
jgi:hypothetical protein